jgi:5'-3' exonuclease/transcription antitermination factor NusG
VANWVVLELSSKAEGEDPDLIRASIRHMMHGAEVFVPASVTELGEDRVIKYLVDGYAFVRHDFPDDKYFRLEGSRYVQNVVTLSGRPNSRKVAFIDDVAIDKFRGLIKLQDDQGIEVGDIVLITSGIFKNIKATVVDEIEEMQSVQVAVHLRSKEDLVTLPRSFLRLVEKAPQPPYIEKSAAMGRWCEVVIKLFEWSGDTSRIVSAYNRLGTLSGWFTRGFYLNTGLQFIGGSGLDTSRLEARLKDLERISAWSQRGKNLYRTLGAVGQDVNPALLIQKQQILSTLNRWWRVGNILAPSLVTVHTSLPVGRLRSKYLEWRRVHSLFSRVSALDKAVTKIERELTRVGADLNVVVDGHNMVCRCATAPGLSELTDSQGRHTGGIVGTLNALSSLRKRFPGSTLWVVWDGSSNRRRKQFTSYKANRGDPKGVFEIEWLRSFLPTVGVKQAFNPNEEADDVIAALVRGMLKDKDTIVVTTDRDLLQLVSENVSVLAPAMGAGKEKLYTPDVVREEYGVDPEKMPHLRALSGDTSDNIPGVNGCGLKTAAKYLGLYRTVEDLFKSNLAGLTKNQYTNLRASEKQVKLNVKLMTLLADVAISHVPACPDQSVATERLKDVDVKAERVVPPFFQRMEQQSLSFG